MTSERRSPVSSVVSSQTGLGVRDGCVTLRRGASPEDCHARLRGSVGLVDDSYYTKLKVGGPAALEVTNRLALGDVSRLPVKRMMSTFLMRADGLPFGDALIVNEGDGYLLLVEGASSTTVLEHVARESTGASVTDLTTDLALIGLDGPFAWELLKDLAGIGILGARFLDVLTDQTIGGRPVTMYRAGKTGEFGYLLRVDAAAAPELWGHLADAGTRYGILECGFEDIDLCKLENRVVNMEREGAKVESVLELNCRITVSRDKGDYVGRQAVAQVLASGVKRRLIGLAAERGSAAIELGAPVSYQGQPIGSVVNVGFSPGLGRWIATALLDQAYAYVGLDYDVAREGGAVSVRTVSAPFVLNRSLSVRPQEDSFFAQR